MDESYVLQRSYGLDSQGGGTCTAHTPTSTILQQTSAACLQSRTKAARYGTRTNYPGCFGCFGPRTVSSSSRAVVPVTCSGMGHDGSRVAVSEHHVYLCTSCVMLGKQSSPSFSYVSALCPFHLSQALYCFQLIAICIRYSGTLAFDLLSISCCSGVCVVFTGIVAGQHRHGLTRNLRAG